MVLIAAAMPTMEASGAGTVVPAFRGGIVFTVGEPEAAGADGAGALRAGGGAGNFGRVFDPGGRPRFFGAVVEVGAAAPDATTFAESGIFSDTPGF